MFRLSSLIKSTLQEGPSRSLDGAIAIWNFTNRCNLSCLHCYSKSSLEEKDTLTTQKIFETLEQMKRAGVKFVIFSGGEPLTRKDIFDIAKKCEELGIKTYLSTNGLYINPGNVRKILDHFGYIGISIDGDEKTHDRFRGLPGAYKKSLQAIEMIHEAGGKVGIRFTITKETIGSLEHIFDLAENMGIDKIYISHLVYSGRGLDNLKMDLSKEERKRAVEYIFDKAFRYYDEDQGIDIVTGNMEMDAVTLLQYFKKRFPEKYEALYRKLLRWGGNSAGRNLVNIDSEGNVKPDPFFPVTLGNIYQKPFDEIWLDSDNELLQRLRAHPRNIKGKCEECEFVEICNGGSRPRAWAIYGDLWAEDPSCYIEKEKV